jgi:hypothetical protein
VKPIEDVFSSDTFRRVVLPGIVLASGIHPLVMKFILVTESLYGFSALAMLVSEVVVFGLVLSSAIQWIFYVYEGFRLSWLTSLAFRANERRVAKLSMAVYGPRPAASLSTAQQNALYESYEHLRDFPIRRDEDGRTERYAERSTLLGNIIATYELYPEATYGVDGVFYWYHILNFAPGSLRTEFAEQIAFMESLVLTSFAGALVALVHAFVLLGLAIGFWFRRLAVFSLDFGPRLSACLLIFGVAVWILFYLAALQPSRDASKIFRTLVDIAMPSFAEWLPSANPSVSSSVAQKAKVFKSYLRGD